MKILVFGANGKVGSVVTKKLLEASYEVTAFVHGDSLLGENDQLTTFQGDIYNEADIVKVIEGHDVIISCLGSWGTPKKDILSSAMKHIIPAMEHASIQRIITLTGAAAIYPGERTSLFERLNRALLRIVARKILDDGEQHIALLSSSHLDWTVLRSPVMNEKGKTSFALHDKAPAPWATIHRHAVADAIIAQINDSSYYKQAPFIERISST